MFGIRGHLFAGRLWKIIFLALFIFPLWGHFFVYVFTLKRDYLIDWLGGLDGLQGLYGLDRRLDEYWQIFGIFHIVAGIFTASGRTCSSGWGFEALVISFMFCSLWRFVYNVLLCLCLMRFVSAVLTCRWPGADPSPEEQRRNPQVQKNIRSPFVQNYIIRSPFLRKYLIWSLFVQKYIIRSPLCQKIYRMRLSFVGRDTIISAFKINQIKYFVEKKIHFVEKDTLYCLMTMIRAHQENCPPYKHSIVQFELLWHHWELEKRKY